MNSDEPTKPKHGDLADWSVINAEANGYEILQRNIPANGFAEAASVCSEIAAFLEPHSRTDDAFNTQISIRGWRVEVIIAVKNTSPLPVWIHDLAVTIRNRFGE